MALAFIAAGYFAWPFLVWTLLIAALLVGLAAPVWLMALFAAVAVVFLLAPLRRTLFSAMVMETMKAFKLIPYISPTERTALEAGVVWMEAELFSGQPNFKRILAQPYHQLSVEEISFLENEVEQLCAMVDDYKIFRTRTLPPEVWDFIRRKGFLGMIIPKEYGGKGFSHSAHSAVIQKVTTRGVCMVTYVMVPNSLGPAELLVRYGTDAQKHKYLRRLASGDEIPCFGLTEPAAGSDAGAISAEGVLFRGEDGQIYIRLNWSKRWITLAAISTLIGLAFKLRDPDNLLGKGTSELGITCALVPAHLKGVVVGRRHDPMGLPFHNCPTQGHDVIMRADEAIIGGLGGAGRGWQMLMECLGVGRGISLPAQSAAGAKLIARVVGSHATIRKQFGLSIAKFEGVEEPLARIAGCAYYLEALRNYVLSALDQHISPAVVTAIAKYTSTEECRDAVNDGMDILGGAGISMGPRNTLALTYIATPIGITVEGANILTRTLMIFGQGALRAHPFAFAEINAIERGDLVAFDRALVGHIGHVLRNLTRSVVLSLTRGAFVRSPVGGPTRRYVQKLSWISASFAIMSDLAMAMLGGKLKVKEKLTGRFADILSWMFIASAVLKRFEAEGRRPEDKVFLDFSMAVAFQRIQEAFDGIFANFDVPGLQWFFKGPVRWWSRINLISLSPSDSLSHQVAHAIVSNVEQRDRLTQGMYIPSQPDQAIARLERAYKIVRQAEAVECKIRDAVLSRRLNKKSKTLLDDAVKAGVIQPEEFACLTEADKVRADAIQVDDYSDAEFLHFEAPTPAKPQPRVEMDL